MYDLSILLNRIKGDLESYAKSRMNDVARGAETPELAGLLVQKYGYGLAKALQLACELADFPAPSLISEVDRYVANIDPLWRENQIRRFESRPASILVT